MNASNFSNDIVDDFGLENKNDCEVLCNLLLGFFIGIILLYGFFFCREFCNMFNARRNTDFTDCLI